MPSAVVEALLEVAPVFDKFSQRERAELLEATTEETYAAGLEIVSHGEQAREMFVLAEGTVEVIESRGPDDETVLATLIPPGAFGEVAFFERSKHIVTVRTLTPVRVLSIDREGLDRLIDRQSLVAYKLAHNVLMKLGYQMRRVEEWVSEESRDADTITQPRWAAFRAKLYQEWEI